MWISLFLYTHFINFPDENSLGLFGRYRMQSRRKSDELLPPVSLNVHTFPHTRGNLSLFFMTFHPILNFQMYEESFHIFLSEYFLGLINYVFSRYADEVIGILTDKF